MSQAMKKYYFEGPTFKLSGGSRSRVPGSGVLRSLSHFCTMPFYSRLKNILCLEMNDFLVHKKKMKFVCFFSIFYLF